jgi:ABC-type antimicrobial peptide transport system permease subunit
MALGASPSRVLRLIVRQALVVTAAGVALGLLAAWAAARLMRSLLVGVQATDPAVLCAVAAILMGTALLASLRPALRAAQVDPMIALRDMGSAPDASGRTQA